MAAPSLSRQEVLAFLRPRYGQVEGLERLAGGFWSAAYGFRSAGRELVARFGADRSWFEADRSAMAFASAELPVPEVLEVGDGPAGAYAISVRHQGSYLEAVRPEQSDRAAPMLARLLEGLFRVPKGPDLLVGWHTQPPQPEMGWRDWLLSALLHDPNRDIARWTDKLASDPDLERLYRAAESRIKDLALDCPERRDLVHGDLLHGNVLVTEDASELNAVFSWKCSLRGDFLYDVAWCTFWGGVHPGIAAADPWGWMVSSDVIATDSAALADAAERHHCYELQIGACHLGWNVWVADDAALAQTARLLAAVLERGPLSPPDKQTRAVGRRAVQPAEAEVTSLILRGPNQVMPSSLAGSIQAYVSGRGSPEGVVASAAPLCRRQALGLVEASAVDDVVQESLIELLASAGRLRRPEAAEAWLRLIVRKQAERHRRRLRLPLPLDLAAEFPSPADGPEAELVRAEGDAAVRRALQAARDVDRQLLVLRYVGEWSDAELAELLGTTPGAIRKRLHDARRRLRPYLEHPSPPVPLEESMTEPRSIPYGSSVSPAELAEFPAVSLDPAGADVLPTGVRVVDAVVPIRRGGTLDFRGPAGTGQLVLICEIAGNLAAVGRSAVIAVASPAKHADGSATRLERLLDDPDGIPGLTVVVDAGSGPAAALRAAGGLAGHLAGEGVEVILAVDRTTCDRLDPADLARHAGRTAAGSVTVVRVAPHARDAAPAEPWALDTTLVLSLERMAMGIFPTVDVLASRSGLIENRELAAPAISVAVGVRRSLGAASALDQKLAQPFHVAEAYTGTPGVRVTPEQARAELAALL